VFKHWKTIDLERNPRRDLRPKRSVPPVTFDLPSQRFIALNGGSQYAPFPISLLVSCESQADADVRWEKLSARGEKHDCGWLRDWHGASRQIEPRLLGDRLREPDGR